MTAENTTTAERFVPPPKPFVAGRWRLPRFTRRDAETLVRLGIIPEDASTELLHGLIVLKDRAGTGEDPMVIGNDHTKVVERLSDLRASINSSARHVRSQQPLVCNETHVPEPDFMVLRGTLGEYADLPQALDAWCIVEVADASYERDVGEKLVGYARAGVRQYIVINIRNRTAEIYSHPDSAAGTYALPTVVSADQELSLRIGEEQTLSVRLGDLLP